MTPRFNADVNGYWMCDIGRFDFGWIEGDDRLQKPLMRGAGGAQQPGVDRGHCQTRGYVSAAGTSGYW
jgi:NADH-quinone oxidoreductase subunit G